MNGHGNRFGRNTLTLKMAMALAVSPGVFASPAETPALSGEAIYQQSCIACHGAGGEDGMPGVPDLTDKPGSLGQSDEVLIRHITEGFQSPGAQMAMPAKGGNPNLSAADIRAVLAYIRKTF